MKRSHLGQYKEDLAKESDLEQKLVEEKALVEAISVGARCEVRASGQPNKRGTVMYAGEYSWDFYVPKNAFQKATGLCWWWLFF